MKNNPFRLGTTSYIVPDDILPNVRYLAGKVRDIELILFEVDDGPNNLPSTEVIDELTTIAQENDLTYTVPDVIITDALAYTDRHSFHIPSCEPAICMKAFIHHYQISCFLKYIFIIYRQEASDIDECIFFCTHRSAIRQ